MGPLGERGEDREKDGGGGGPSTRRQNEGEKYERWEWHSALYDTMTPFIGPFPFLIMTTNRLYEWRMGPPGGGTVQPDVLEG